MIYTIGGGDGGGGGGGAGAMPPTPPHFYGIIFARKDRDTLLIEQSGSRYSNRAVHSIREASYLATYL